MITKYLDTRNAIGVPFVFQLFLFALFSLATDYYGQKAPILYYCYFALTPLLSGTFVKGIIAEAMENSQIKWSVNSVQIKILKVVFGSGIGAIFFIVLTNFQLNQRPDLLLYSWIACLVVSFIWSTRFFLDSSLGFVPILVIGGALTLWGFYISNNLESALLGEAAKILWFGIFYLYGVKSRREKNSIPSMASVDKSGSV